MSNFINSYCKRCTKEILSLISPFSPCNDSDFYRLSRICKNCITDTERNEILEIQLKGRLKQCQNS